MSPLLLISSLALATFSQGTDVLWEDSFEDGVKPAWQWVREDKSQWRCEPGKFIVRSQPGGIWGGQDDIRNILLAPVQTPANTAARISVSHKPHEKYEQAGLLWYVDDDTFVKLISEQIDGEMYVVTARELPDGRKVVGKVVVPGPNIQLRLKVEGETVTGQWRLDETRKWIDAGSCEFSRDGTPRFGLFTQSGSPEVARWVTFRKFLVERLPEPNPVK